MISKIAVLDIETTAIKHWDGAIVEIGIVELNIKTGEIKPIFNILVNEKGKFNPEKKAWIFENSDLTPELIVKEGKNIEEFREELQNILDNYPIGAYNCVFDFSWLESRKFKIKNPLECPMLISTSICKIWSNYYGRNKWPSVNEAYNFFFKNNEYDEKHRALDDAIHEAKIVFELVKRGEYNFDYPIFAKFSHHFNKLDEKKFTLIRSVNYQKEHREIRINSIGWIELKNKKFKIVEVEGWEDFKINKIKFTVLKKEMRCEEDKIFIKKRRDFVNRLNFIYKGKKGKFTSNSMVRVFKFKQIGNDE